MKLGKYRFGLFTCYVFEQAYKSRFIVWRGYVFRIWSTQLNIGYVVPSTMDGALRWNSFLTINLPKIRHWQPHFIKANKLIYGEYVPIPLWKSLAKQDKS